MHLDLALMATFPDAGTRKQRWGVPLVSGASQWLPWGRKQEGLREKQQVLSPRVSWGLLKFFFKRRKAGLLPRE